MSWITDRLPTADDVDFAGDVLIPRIGYTERGCHWERVSEIKLGDPWMPAPPVYDPPPTREELVEELLDAIDDESDYDMWQVAWRLKVIKAREKLK